jgi:endonuclease III
MMSNKIPLSLKDILKKIPKFSTELGLNLNDSKDRFKWFLASMLFAKRISVNIAKKTFKRFIDEGLIDVDTILKAGWNRLVEVLDSGGYVRYDFSTATNILENCKKLNDEYNGDLEVLHDKALDSKDLEAKLMKLKGFGPIAINIFLRELRGIWSKANPKPSKMALEVAKCLGLSKEEIKEFESSLVRIKIEYCKKSKCKECCVNVYCRKTL